MSAGRRARGGVAFRVVPPAPPAPPHGRPGLGLLATLLAWGAVIALVHLAARAWA